LFAAALGRGDDVTVLARDASRELIIDGERARAEVSADPARLRACGAVLIAVKTYATEAALAACAPHLDPGALLVSLQNGLEQRAMIEAALGTARPILLAPTSEAATLLATGGVRRVGAGSTTLGWASDVRDERRRAALLEAFGRAGLAVRFAEPIEPHVWAKAIVNAALNPVTALAGVVNGEVLASPALLRRALTLGAEAYAVARAEGVTLPFADAAAEIEAVARASAANRSSMLQDLECGRPTEIDAINGAIVRRGRARGVATPENERIVDEVRARARA
jgi:2-dehydropantoate 2-reductase